MNTPLWVAIPVITLVVLATRADVRSRTIPNRLTGPALLLGVAVRFALGGAPGAVDALFGALLAGGLLFPGWLARFMGAGDVKLMAAVGAWLGHPGGLIAAVVALIAGGVIALVVAIRYGVLLQALRNCAALVTGLSRGPGRRPTPVTSGVRFPFAPAVLAGVVFVLLRQA